MQCIQCIEMDQNELSARDGRICAKQVIMQMQRNVVRNRLVHSRGIPTIYFIFNIQSLIFLHTLPLPIKTSIHAIISLIFSGSIVDTGQGLYFYYKYVQLFFLSNLCSYLFDIDSRLSREHQGQLNDFHVTTLDPFIAGLKSVARGAGQHPQLWYNNHIPRPLWSYCLIV